LEQPKTLKNLLGQLREHKNALFQERLIKVVAHNRIKHRRAEFVFCLFIFLFFLMLVSSLAIIAINCSFVEDSYRLANPGISERFAEDITLFLRGEKERIHYLDQKEIEHLYDVREVMRVIIPVASVILLLSSLSIVLLVEKGFLGKKGITQGFLIACLLLAVFLAAVMVSFTCSFELFHVILFPEGNYTFPYYSMLIISLPESFFINFFLVSAGLAVLVNAFIMLLLLELHKRKNSKNP